MINVGLLSELPRPRGGASKTISSPLTGEDKGGGENFINFFPLTQTLSLQGRGNYIVVIHPRSHPSTGSGQGKGYSDIFS